ncbi:MAG: porin family protein [Bacteroidota bacterium]|nr:porin family protein [Bacteroidota bacterium]
MKKLILAAALLLSVTIASAQFNFGVKAGYNSSLGINDLGSVTNGTYNLNSVNSELSNGFQAGVFLRFGFNALYLQPELLYDMGKKNYTLSVNDANNTFVGTFEKNVTVSTVDLPILLGYKVLDLKVANLRVFAGPKLRFNAGSTLDFKNITGGGFHASDLQKDVKAAQLGLEAGFGVDVLMLTLDFRYQVINDMYQTKLQNVTIDNIPANTFVISLGWKIF